MRIATIAGQELTAEHVSAWSALQAAERSLDSPFFRPEFARAVAAARKDVEVAIVEDGGRFVGFLPFQRGRDNVGRPLAGPLSDFQGIVLEGAYSIDPVELIRGCGLSAWHFDHLLTSQAAFAAFHWTRDRSPYIDISAGFESYLEGRRAAQAADVLQALSKRKRAERQVGPVRFVAHTTDRCVLAKLIEWKTQQYERTRITNVLAFPWVARLREQLLETEETPDFAGTLSALYLGDRLAAAHFGMRSARTHHWWFPAYDPELSKYSPGAQLLLELTRSASLNGIERIDLGVGQESYKQGFMTGDVDVAVGSVDCRPVARTARRLWHHTKRWVRESPFRESATVPWRFIRRMRDRVHFR